jgi:hypothetical protein
VNTIAVQNSVNCVAWILAKIVERACGVELDASTGFPGLVKDSKVESTICMHRKSKSADVLSVIDVWRLLVQSNAHCFQLVGQNISMLIVLFTSSIQNHKDEIRRSCYSDDFATSSLSTTSTCDQ